MTPFALAAVRLDADRVQQREPVPASGPSLDLANAGILPPIADMPTQQERRRITSHYNHFQTFCNPVTFDPPSYAVSQARAAKWMPAQIGHLNSGNEVLPKYQCTIAYEGVMLQKTEMESPLRGLQESYWREVYVMLRGTALYIHRFKHGGAGKLWRQYTLQHAEIGFAPDVHHTVLIPQTRLAHLIPSSTRWKAWKRDPDLFQLVRQSIIRLRLETDQLLLASSSENVLTVWVNSISAGIDLAPALDERSVTRQCTVPRRRRRQRQRTDGDLTDRRLIEEQEHILRDLYPEFAQDPSNDANEAIPGTSTSAQQKQARVTPQTVDTQDDDLDLAMMAEDPQSTPSSGGRNATSTSSLTDHSYLPVSRQTTASSATSTFSSDTIHAMNPVDFDIDGKWAPVHPRTAAQQQRYVRRCMPILPADAPRASDILICSGRRVRLNWKMELMEEWELQPPTYKSHDFNAATVQLSRTVSQSSASGSSTSAVRYAPQSSSSMFGPKDTIDELVLAPSGLAQLSLDKVASATGDKTITIEPAPQRRPELPTIQLSTFKAEEARGTDVHGVIYCF